MPLNKEQAEECTKKLGQATVRAVRAANALPDGRDYTLQRGSYPDFQARVAGPKGSGRIEKRVLSLLDSIFTLANVTASSFAKAKGADPDDVFETVVDFADSRLEAVDFLMDEMTGRAPTIKAGVVGASAYGGGGKGGKFSALIRGRPEDLGLAKPQLLFKDPIDNARDTPFVPKLTPPSPISSARPMDDTPFTLVDTRTALEGLCAAVRGCDAVAVDLEHHSLRSFQGFTCLMQVSTREQDFVVDTLALRDEMHLLLPILTDPALTKVMHGADSDMRWLEHDFGLYVVNLFDTGQAARVLELPSFALAYLLERFCEQTPDKKYQLADWRVRPLPAEMLAYARMDTHFLLYIYDHLRALLLERDAGGDRLVRSVLSLSTSVAQLRYEKPVFTAEEHLDVINRSGRVLTPGQAKVFAAAFEWRDDVARERDESREFVLPTALLFKVAVAGPTTRAALLEVCKPNVPPLVRECVEALAALCSAAAATAPAGAERNEGVSAAGSDGSAAGVRAGAAGGRYSLAGWVAEEVVGQDDESHRKRPKPVVHLHQSNRIGADGGGQPGAVRAQTLFMGTKKIVLLPGGEVVVGTQADMPQRVDASAHDKVQRIVDSFTVEVPQALFVTAADDAAVPVPAAAAEREADGAGAVEEVEDMKGVGLDADGQPRSIKETFKGPRKSAVRAGSAGEGGDGAVEERPAKKRKEVGGDETDWVKALGWKDHLRGKMAELGGADGAEIGDGAGVGAAEEFRAFDYDAVSKEDVTKSKKQQKLDAKALLEGHFNPMSGLDGKDKQVRAQRRAKPSGKSITFGSSGGPKSGGSGSKGRG